MDDNRIQQVLMIEKEAQEIADAAIREAEQLPLQAEQEAQALIDKARADAQEEARRLVANAEAKDECARIQAEAEEKIKRTKNLSIGHLDRAVTHVIDRVVGRE
jgi:V/A-type H+-transporting ATPase subunit G/H